MFRKKKQRKFRKFRIQIIALLTFNAKWSLFVPAAVPLVSAFWPSTVTLAK
jgi:hypothetical protein